MADNTQVNVGSGDKVRDLDRLGLGIKTQVVQIDFGGGNANAESLASLTNPLPVTVGNFPATQTVTGTVAVSGTSTITGTITATQGGAPWTMKPDGIAWTLTGTSANVDVTNFPATQAVTQSGTWNIGTVATITNPVAVTGTFWQTTQPVSGTIAATQSGAWSTGRTWALTSGTDTVASAQSGTWNVGITGTATIAGTVTANQGGAPWTMKPDGVVWTLTGTSANVDITNTPAVSQSGTWTVQQGSPPWSTKPDGTVWSLTSTSANVNVTNFPGTQTISGTVTANQGGAPWSQNVTQFGGIALSTGTGASGTGIPRVTVSNDSNVLATQSGAWTAGRTWTLASGTDSVAAVQSGTWNIGTIASITAAVAVTQSGAWTVAATQSGTWTTGRTWSLASGADSVTATISGNPADNIAQWGGTAVAAATAYGTAPAGNVGAVNAYITNTVPITGTIVTSAALAPNASQETGGNLNAIMVLLTQILLELRALRMQDATVHGVIIDPETNELAVTPSWN